MTQFEFFALAFGSMIGVGWVTAVGGWLTQAGPMGAIIAFVIGGGIMLCIGLCYAEATPMLPVAGGEVAYSYLAFGTFKAFVVGWFLAFGYIAISGFEAISIGKVLGYMFPDSNWWLLYRVDNKIETVRIGDRAGVPSVPNKLAPVKSWSDLEAVMKELGGAVVVQTAFGDSGHTTFFIENEEDYKKHAEEIASEDEVKVMKRIRCRGSALEACTTKQGTIVGPLMTELVGFKELTPYKGGWCGNEVFAGSFTPELRDQAVAYTFAFGEQLRKEGYRGYFELDFLIDMDANQLYLGELNPRITGASSITNHAAFAHADAPLFLFHLLEFADIEFEFDVNELNARWADPDNIDEWSQLVIKHVDDTVDVITEAPESGIWRLKPDGTMGYARFDYHRRAVETEDEAFWLRISGPGDYRYEGADLGILITRGRLMTDDFELTDRAKAFIRDLRGAYVGKPLTADDRAAAPVSLEPGSFKIL